MSDADPHAGHAAFRRVLASRLDEIAVLADELSQWAGEAGVPPRTAMQVNLMLDELVTNVILYGYRNAPGESIRIEAQVLGDALQVLVTDYAFAYDPLQAQTPELESGLQEREVGGLGIHFVRTLADEVSYERIDDGGRPANRVRILKRLR